MAEQAKMMPENQTGPASAARRVGVSAEVGRLQERGDGSAGCNDFRNGISHELPPVDRHTRAGTACSARCRIGEARRRLALGADPTPGVTCGWILVERCERCTGMVEGPPDGLPRYRVLTGADDENFCRRVSTALDLGFRLHGGPSVTYNGKQVIVAQALLWPNE